SSNAGLFRKPPPPSRTPPPPPPSGGGAGAWPMVTPLDWRQSRNAWRSASVIGEGVAVWVKVWPPVLMSATIWGTVPVWSSAGATTTAAEEEATATAGPTGTAPFRHRGRRRRGRRGRGGRRRRAGHPGHEDVGAHRLERGEHLVLGVVEALGHADDADDQAHA